MKDFEHYLRIANYDIQMANNHNALKSYVAGLLYYYDDLVEENVELKNQQKEFVKYFEDEKDRLAREVSSVYEDSLGKTRLINEDIFNEVNKILAKYNEFILEKVSKK